MAPVKTLFAAVVLMFSSLAVLPAPDASAQTNIITIDRNRIMRDSAGGKDIAAKVQAIGTSMQNELQSEASAIETEGKALDSRTANLTREAVAADPTLRSQVEAYARKAQSFQQKQAIRARELQQTEQNAWAQFFQALQPVVEEVAGERGAQVVMERSGTYFSADSLDATDAVISKMNARSSSFTVTRARAQTAPETVQ